MLRDLMVCICFLSLSLLVSSCEQAPLPEPEKPKGVLRIATIPTDMPIIVNGQLKGNSPPSEGQYFSISLEEGEHEVEILKPVDDEKDQYAKKTVFIGADTLQIAIIEAKVRLTTFGEAAKAKREAEEIEKDILRKEKEKIRLAALEKALIAPTKYLNSEEVLQEDTEGDSVTLSYQISKCDLKLVVKNYFGMYNYFMKLNDLDLMEKWQGEFKCTNKVKCIDVTSNTYKGDGPVSIPNHSYDMYAYYNKYDLDDSKKTKIVSSFNTIIKNCKAIR